MGEQKSQKSVPAPWQVPVAVADISAETGRHFDLVADAGVRAAVAAIAGLRDLPRLQANFDVTRRGTGGLHVTGTVSATVGQNCVVTLEPLANEVEETVDLVFVPQAAPAPNDGRNGDGSDEPEAEPRDVRWDDPEPLIGGVVDLGALTTEFLLVGLDPYPRKPDAVFDAPPDAKPEDSPFAVLAKLTKGQDGR
jgi:Large ribosomal RNA subunit accumulation protein YceD